ncbi:MAG TPA: Re/Si-specific NAD(P)(+) transhydrogenase subunit alpha [Phenylobacterium sp.]|uniref:Re/Si-specific NAD(P)(+) transhydrogenase subunit alpha n=1 Tax=Phenylobacterium sp. TaxID=1871053 RepID=UPI002B46DD31|nr:Re/Si-specific NAD(P)(+) transhydrogenase subunit alpha [Phenylobacterium sp.]HKR87762.1 Re/Si-specific NAD(P)(+) transhydrogenase subunit alpha [Phenylobacterium sp.]
MGSDSRAVGVVKEVFPGEARVALTPEAAKKFKAGGVTVLVERGAGIAASFPDADYAAAGAELVDRAAVLAAADALLTVRPPQAAEVARLRRGATVVGLLDPSRNAPLLAAIAAQGLSAYAMELLPRTTRAQVMDALSSQANLAGYRAVIEAAAVYGRAMPMMTTAAGTITPARVFVMGAGVAGLQAIATARRLGAVVTATDVRPAAKEQVQSLGAKFVAVEDEEFQAAESAGGYAKAMSAEYQAKQAALISDHIKKQDMVITTALIPGRPAPRLVSAEQVASMRPGSVLLDLAVEQGGNVEGVVAGQVTTTAGGVHVIGYENLPARVAVDSSTLYARNLLAFVQHLFEQPEGAETDDDILRASSVVRRGAVVFPAPAA